MPRSASDATVSQQSSAPGRPEVERRLGVVDPEAGPLERLAQLGPPSGVPGVLLDDVRVVVEGRDHRGLLRRGHHQPEVLAYGEQLADHGRVAGDEGTPVARQVGPLRQRVDREDPLVAAAGDVRVQHRDRLGLPGALEVALVGDQQDTALAAPVDDLLQVLDRQHPAGRVGRRVEPDQRRGLRAERGQRVGGHGAGAGQRRADLVRRVGQRRVDDQVGRTEPEMGREGGDQLLGADRRDHAVQPEPGDAVPAGEPVDARLPRLGAPDRERVAGRVGGGAQRLLHDRRGRVDRRTDREVDDAVGVRPSPLGVGRQLVPGEVREPRGDAGGHSWFCHSWFWGGRPAMNGWSWSISPILAAPPGEPRSSKKFTLAV